MKCASSHNNIPFFCFFRFVSVIFFMYWRILWQNAFYLYLDSFKWILEYHEVCLLGISSGIIEDMKTAQRNKQEKLKIVNLDTRLLSRINEVPWYLLISLNLSSFVDPEFPDLFFGPCWLVLLAFCSLKF